MPRLIVLLEVEDLTPRGARWRCGLCPDTGKGRDRDDAQRRGESHLVWKHPEV